jgi:hypothetical protein
MSIIDDPTPMEQAPSRKGHSLVPYLSTGFGNMVSWLVSVTPFLTMIRSACIVCTKSCILVNNPKVAWMWALGAKWLCRVRTDGMAPAVGCGFHGHEPHDNLDFDVC